MLSTLRTLFKMTRPVNIVIAVITLLVGYELLGHQPGYPLIAQALAFAFAIGFANIQNDILDLESDKLNRPERPLVTEKVSVKAARIAWITMAILTLACGLADHFASLGFFILLAVLLIAYNKWLKHIPLVKNLTVAFLCTTPLFFAGIYTILFEQNCDPDEYIWAIIPAIPFAFLLTAAREIYKDLEDEAGDRKAGIMTFPLFAGSKTANRLAGAIVLLTWISLPIPVFCMDKMFRQNYPLLFLIITGISLTPLFAATLIFAHKKSYRQAQKLVKVAMFIGLVALIVSSN